MITYYIVGTYPNYDDFHLFILFKQTSLRSSLISYAVCVGIVLLSPTFQLGISETVHATIKGWLICFIVGYVLFFGIFYFTS